MSEDFCYDRQSIRMQGYDYSSNGYYFVTICVQDHECLFGKIVDGKMELNDYGEMANSIIRLLPERFPVIVDIYQIMPNHVHIIFAIVGAIRESPDNKKISVGDQWGRGGGQWAHRDAPLRKGGHRSLLSKIIGYLKMNSTKKIHQTNPNIRIWQRNYWDRIIRNEREHFKIVNYIRTNPENWANDALFCRGDSRIARYNKHMR